MLGSRKSAWAMAALAGGVLGMAHAAQAQQVVATWLAPVSGNWDSPGLWSSTPFFPNNGNPGGTTYAVVAPVGNYTLTVNTNATVDSIDMLGGILRVDQRILTLAGNGPINLGPSARLHLFFGTLSGAVVNLGSTTTGLRLEGPENTLNAVTINGNSTFTDNTSGANITGGLTLNGTLTFQNRVGGFMFNGTQSVTGGTFFYDATINPQARILSASEGSVVTFDPNVVVHGQNFRVQGPTTSGMLVNQGRISADVAGNTVSIVGRVNNTGTIEAINGATIETDGTGWSSSGLVRVGAGSTLNLRGQGSIAGSTFDTAAGTVNILGTLNHTGQTLALDASSGSWNLGALNFPGVISGGMLTTTNGAALNVPQPGLNQLVGVAFDGLLNVAPAARLTIDGGSLAGTTTVGTGAIVTFSNNWSSNALINTNGATLSLGGAFTLGPGFDMQRTGGTVNLSGALNNTGSTLQLDASTGSWNLTGGSITGGTLRLLDNVTLAPNASSQNRLFGVTLDGTLSVTTSGARVRSVNGLSGGTVRLSGPDAALVFDNSQTLTSEVLYAGTAGANARLAIEQASVLTIAPGTLIHGGRATIGGSLFNPGASSIINQGTISADVPGQTLTINAAASAMNNQGLVRAVGGGAMVLNGLTGSTGNIAADGTGSTFGLGGTYTINSPASVTNGATLSLTGTWTNAAGINLTDSTLSLGGSFTTAGVGTVNRTNSTIRVPGTWNNTGATINLSPGNPILLAGGTISGGLISGAGGGTLGAVPATTSTLTNVTLNADLDLTGSTLNTTGLTFGGVANINSGSTMSLNGAWTNNGTINVNASTLNLGGSVTNVGTINRSGNAVVNLSGILNAPGQTITISPTSLITGINGGELHAGTLNLVDGPTLTMGGGAVHTGDIAGDGVITLANGAALTPPTPGPGGMMTIAPGVTVRGNAGSIGHFPQLNSSDVVVNNGVIAANATGSGINIWARNFTNAGLLEVSNNGTLWLYRNSSDELYTDWTNTGTIRVSSGQLFMGGHFQTADIGTVEHLGGDIIIYGDLDNANATLNLDTPWILTSSLGRIRNGVVNVDPSTHLEIRDHGTLDGVTFNGDIYSDFSEIRGGLTLNGTATIPNRMSLVGDQTIAAGDFQLVGGTMDSGQGTAFTFASPVVVHGRGFLSASSVQALVNEGRISADVANQSLTINQSTLVNFGTLEAVNGATLTLNALSVFNEGVVRVATGGRFNLGGSDIHLGGGLLLNDGGTLTITGTVNNIGSTITVGGSAGNIELSGRINGGTVTSTGGGRLVIPTGGSGQPTLDGVTLDTDVDVLRTIEILNNLNLSQTVHLAPSAGAGLRFLGPTNTLSGGTVSIEGTNSHRIELASGGSLTIGAGTTIHGGTGIIADDTGIGAPGVQNFLTNNGLISADVAGQTLSVAPDVFTNHGVLEAVDGATLNIASQIPGVGGATRTWTNDGTIRVDGGTLLLGGTFPSDSVDNIERTGGEVRLVGRMDNSNATFTLDGPEKSWIFEGGGPQFGEFIGTQIIGGTVNLLNGAEFVVPGANPGPAGGGAIVGAIINGDLSVGGSLYLHNSTINGTVTIGGGRVVLGPPGPPEPATLSSGNFVFLDEGAEFGRIVNSALTIGADVNIRGGHGEVAAIVNHGMISADLATDPLVARIGVNTGLLEAVNGGTLVLAPAGEGLVNNGTIRVIDSSLVFTGSTPVFNSIQRSNATVTFDGVVENSDSLLTLDPDTTWFFQNGLYLKGGTVNISTGAPLPIGSYIGAAGPVSFDGVTINGDMDALPTCERIDVYHGLTLNGMLRVPTPNSIMSFVGDQEFAGGTIFFDAAGGDGERVLRLRGRGINGAGSAVLTINADATVRGGNARISTGNRTSTEATVVNNGLISADLAGKVITIEAQRFINNGTVQAINGGFIFYEGPPPLDPGDPQVFENNGVLSVGAGSVFEADLLQQGRTGSIELLLAGAESFGDYGRVTARTFCFDGALLIDLADGYVPAYGDRFDLFDFTTTQGAFQILSLPQLPGDLIWHTSALYSTGAITVIPTPATLALLTMGTLIAVRRRRA